MSARFRVHTTHGRVLTISASSPDQVRSQVSLDRGTPYYRVEHVDYVAPERITKIKPDRADDPAGAP